MTFERDDDGLETVQVALRIRPLVDTELSQGCKLCLETVPNEPQVQVKQLAFTYNHVFPPHVSQEEFYDSSIRNVVKKLYKGYNVTILAYGQTGSGKTYSMGTCYSESSGHDRDAGVIPRAVADIFDYIFNNTDEFDFKVSVSFMELYREQLYDLLSNKSREQNIIEIREDHRGIVLPGLTEEEVTNVEETMACLLRGSEKRATGATAMNIKSSRSHAIFTIQISKENKEDSNQSTTAKFHLVDLAGSERSKKTKATGDRFKEGVKINQGLLALGNVISALGDGSNKGYVSYRDSKLTRLLQDSLGGNSVTLMIACVSPADYNLEETISTLRYADRAKRIRNKPIINQDAKSVEIIRLNGIIQQLRLQILNEGKCLPQDVTSILQQLEEEKSKNIALNQKYIELLAKNKNLAKLLQKSINEHTTMVERAIVVESSKEKVERKLLELTEVCDRTVEILKNNVDSNDRVLLNKTLDGISEIKLKIVDVQSEQNNCEPMETSVNEEDEINTSNENAQESDLNENDLNEKEEAHAMDQVARNNELQTLMKTLSEKKFLAEKLIADNKCLITYNESMKESEAKVIMKEKERDELMNQLTVAQKSLKIDPQILHERKKKIESLEQEIVELKKKCLQQANLLKLKEKNDQKISALNNEIHQMKSAKVRLIRTMKSENDNFRKWRLRNEKEIAKLSSQDRKRQAAMVKMENDYAKQQHAFKIKMQQAVATNKRLKEALERQKNAQKQRNISNSGKAEAVQQWLDEELELMGSLLAAQHTLDGLMEDRATLNGQLETMKKENPNNSKLANLREDLELRNAQIADLQQKIIVGDQENKTKAKCDTIQSMAEAKLAVKYLFDTIHDVKREVLSYKYKDDSKYEELYEKMKAANDKIVQLENDSIKTKANHRVLLANIEKQNEEKISLLIKQLNYEKNDHGEKSHDSNLLDRLHILQDAFERTKQSKDELESELKALRSESESLKMKSTKQPKKTVVNKVLSNAYLEDSYEVTSDEDVSKDPDWAKTPRRIKQSRGNRTTIDNFDDKQAVKRNSDGQAKCSCKTICGSKLCSCRKLNMGCSSQCKCSTDKCINRGMKIDITFVKSEDSTDKSDLINNIFLKSGDSSDESDLEDSTSEDGKKKPRFNDENDSKVSNRDKKRSFFYP